jgi:hypothetical protein
MCVILEYLLFATECKINGILFSKESVAEAQARFKKQIHEDVACATTEEK